MYFKLIIKIIIFIIAIFAEYIFICTHYVAAGECASLLYYNPIGLLDCFLIALIALFLYLLSIIIFKSVPGRWKLIEGIVYLFLVFLLSFLGSRILESRTEDWPEIYNPRPIQKIVDNRV